MNSNDNKTPLEYYERAIQELTNTREQLQTELESLRVEFEVCRGMNSPSNKQSPFQRTNN
ncbi:MAG: hypothetical protein WAN66_12015 [Limnoraphis robusta]